MTISPETIQRLRVLSIHLNMVCNVFEGGNGNYEPQPNLPPEYDWIVGGFGICDLVGRKQLTEKESEATSLQA